LSSPPSNRSALGVVLIIVGVVLVIAGLVSMLLYRRFRTR
jgi:uncharacterized membrane protein YidH (DUF202 family)